MSGRVVLIPTLSNTWYKYNDHTVTLIRQTRLLYFLLTGTCILHISSRMTRISASCNTCIGPCCIVIVSPCRVVSRVSESVSVL